MFSPRIKSLVLHVLGANPPVQVVFLLDPLAVVYQLLTGVLRVCTFRLLLRALLLLLIVAAIIAAYRVLGEGKRSKIIVYGVFSPRSTQRHEPDGRRNKP